MEKLRLDKWLWAARFFKTRALAKKAIEGGKIRVDGQRPKVSKEITVGMTLAIRQGWDEKVVIVQSLSDQRRGAPDAATLYQETEDSVIQREKLALQRKQANQASLPGESRPTKKQRRQIHQFKNRNLD